MLFALLCCARLAQSPTLVGSNEQQFPGGSNSTSLTLSLPGGMTAEDLIVASPELASNATITPAC